MTTPPAGFTLHPMLAKIYQARNRVSSAIAASDATNILFLALWATCSPLPLLLACNIA